MNGVTVTLGAQAPGCREHDGRELRRQSMAQALVIDAIFDAIGAINREYVEVGFNVNEQCAGSGANTCALWRQGWTGLLLDGGHANASINLHTEMVYSHNVEALLAKYGVSTWPDYVSVDIDSWDLWVVDALLRSYRPRLLSVEYNPNIPWRFSLTYPDASMMRTAGEDRVQHSGVYRGGCFYGASARAIDMLSRAHGYEVVAVVPPLDMFMVPAQLAERARHALRTGKLNAFAADNGDVRQRLRDGEMLNAYKYSQWMTAEQAHEMIDFGEWQKRRRSDENGSVALEAARRAALDQLSALGRMWAWLGVEQMLPKTGGCEYDGPSDESRARVKSRGD